MHVEVAVEEYVDVRVKLEVVDAAGLLVDFPAVDEMACLSVDLIAEEVAGPGVDVEVADGLAGPSVDVPITKEIVDSFVDVLIVEDLVSLSVVEES